MKYLFTILALLLLMACGTTEPEPIKLNSDQCGSCKMSIADGRFGAEIITTKGRIYKFDDIICLSSYVQENKMNVAGFYVHDFANENTLIPAETATYLKGGTISSPMRGNIAAFSTTEDAETFKDTLQATTITWSAILDR